MPAVPLSEVGLFDVSHRVLVVDPDVFLPRCVDKDGGGNRRARQDGCRRGVGRAGRAEHLVILDSGV